VNKLEEENVFVSLLGLYQKIMNDEDFEKLPDCDKQLYGGICKKLKIIMEVEDETKLSRI
jgi:hypothetical protein